MTMKQIRSLLLLGIMALTGCEEATVVVVSVMGGVPGEVQSLRVRAFLDGVPGQVLERPAGERLPRFGLNLPAGARGQLRLRLEALDGAADQQRCVVAVAEGSVTTDGERYKELPVFLSRLPEQDRSCSVQIDRQGDGVVTSEDGQIDCGEHCVAEYPVLRGLKLLARPAAGSYFAGWSGEGIACAVQDAGGENACQTTPQRPMRVAVRFTPNPTVSILIEGSGEVIGDLPCKDRCAPRIVPGRKLRLQGQVAGRSRFLGFDVQPPEAGVCANVFEPCEITIGSAAVQVKARFEEKTCAGAWCVEHPVGAQTERNLWAISGHPTGGLWAVGGAGLVLRFEPGAGRWATETVPTTNDLRAIWAQGGERGWAVTGKEVLVRSRMAGSAPVWKTVPDVGLTAGIYAVGGVGLDTYVTADQGRVRVQRGGDLVRGWEAKNISDPFDLTAIAFTGKLTFVVGTGSTIRREAGASWAVEDAVAAPGHVLVGVWGMDDSAWSVGYDGMERGALLGRDARGAWTKLNIGDFPRFTGISGASVSDFWVTGASATLVRFQGANKTVVDLSQLTSADLRGVYTKDGQDVWVVGNGGIILHHK